LIAPRTLSVVIPVYNAREYIAKTVDTAVNEIERTGFDAEIVLVDDGSSDGSAAVAEKAGAGRLPFTVVSQPNRGRFEARRVGVETASGEWILLLDSRLVLAPDALQWVAERLDHGEEVWAGQLDMEVDGDPYGTFWKLLAELAWNDYYDNPRTTSFGATDFDRFPKGTGCFLAPRQLLLDAIGSFRSRYSDLRYANDDGPLIRWIAERERVNVSPSFSGLYIPRSRLSAFVRHSFHRGTVFLDGHGRSESRFYPVVVGFYPASVVLALAAFRRPIVAPAVAAAVAVAAGALGVKRRRAPFEIASLALLSPVYGLAHGAGMWRGLTLLVQDRVAAKR
jgi:glycosyltransferase involved in cell wall biosynthesis